MTELLKKLCDIDMLLNVHNADVEVIPKIEC